MRNLAFWIPETYLLWFIGFGFAKGPLGWRGVQAVLWPVTFVVRAIARDPLRDPKPLRADYRKIDELEKDLGLAISSASCLEIGLPTTVTPRELHQLKERTQSSQSPERCPCPHPDPR